VRNRTRRVGAVALLASVALTAAACGGDDSGDSAATETTKAGDSAATSTTAASDVPKGGTLVIGAEQEPDCMDWMGSCAGSSLGSWMVNYQTMPRTFDVVADGDGWKYEPTEILDGEPEVKSSPKMEVTYKLSGKGVWDDGTPISCADFKYTWEQVSTGEDIYDTTGYKDVESVNEAGPNTCVVTFKNPYAGWKGTLFGGQFGIYPSHLLQGKDRNAALKDGYTFSGGPFKLEKWEKGVSVSLVPNTKYWGEQPKVDKVIFQLIPDTAQEFNAFKSGEVLAIYPQPQIATIDAMSQGGLDATQIVSTKTGNLEALWMNNEKFPLDSLAVRQAIAYGLDRDALVKALFGGIKVDKAVHSLNPPIVEKYADPQAFSMYKKDLAKVESLMTGDGWAKGSDGIWAKGGQKATIEFMTTAGNKRRELTQQVVQQQLKEAGFEITIANQKAGDLFGQILPAGNYQMGLYAQVATSLDPALCAIACSENIPTAANGNVGQNWQRINFPDIDKNLRVVETSNDDDDRIEAGKAADKVMAENLVSLPLDPLPNISLVSKKIVGPIQDNPIYSVFGNMNQWGIKQ
jgi:peptide/nickel transport system substrate-binding protein